MTPSTTAGVERFLGWLNQRSWFSYSHTLGWTTVSLGERAFHLPVGWGTGRANLQAGQGPLVNVIKDLHARGLRGTFVDVGANSGQSLIDLVRSGVSGIRYLGFEPQLPAALCVNEILRRNNIDGTVLAVGLSNRTGVASFSSNGDASDVGASLSLGSVRSAIAGRVWKVPIMTGDDLIDEPPFLIKIDVEGAEAEVLEGMLRQLSRKTPVYFELLGIASYISGTYSRAWTGGELSSSQTKAIIDSRTSAARRLETILRDHHYEIVDPQTKADVRDLPGQIANSAGESNYLGVDPDLLSGS